MGRADFPTRRQELAGRRPAWNPSLRLVCGLLLDGVSSGSRRDMEPSSADRALERLKLGNERFVSGRVDAVGRDMARLGELVGGQHPFAAVLGCADSRVVPEILFDTGLGDLFVVRVAGNVTNQGSIASLEYAVTHLGTALVVVMGHQHCGAVTAAVAGGDEEVSENGLPAHIQPAIAASPDRNVEAVARLNARIHAERLIRESEIIRSAVQNQGVRVLPAFWSMETGVVEFF